MSDIEKKLSDTTYVVSFKRDVKVRWLQKEAEDAFGHLFPNTQPIATNIGDDENPSGARIIFKLSKKTLTISQVSAQLTMNFEESSKPLTDNLDVADKNIDKFIAAVRKFKADDLLEHHGFIVNLNYKSNEPAEDIDKYLFNHFFKIKPYTDDIKTTGFNLGFETTDSLFVNLSANRYEIRTAKIEPGKTKMVVNTATLPLEEQGYGLKIDINNKPMFANTSRLDTNNSACIVIQRKMRSIIDEYIDDFIGF